MSRCPIHQLDLEVDCPGCHGRICLWVTGTCYASWCLVHREEHRNVATNHHFDSAVLVLLYILDPKGQISGNPQVFGGVTLPDPYNGKNREPRLLGVASALWPAFCLRFSVAGHVDILWGDLSAPKNQPKKNWRFLSVCQAQPGPAIALKPSNSNLSGSLNWCIIPFRDALLTTSNDHRWSFILGKKSHLMVCRTGLLLLSIQMQHDASQLSQIIQICHSLLDIPVEVGWSRHPKVMRRRSFSPALRCCTKSEAPESLWQWISTFGTCRRNSPKICSCD